MTIVKRYNEWGTKSLGDQRHHNQEQEAILTDWQQAQLCQVLCEKSPDGGLWNGLKVADWLSELTRRQVSRHRGWEYLKQMTFRLRVPRLEHVESDPLETVLTDIKSDSR